MTRNIATLVAKAAELGANSQEGGINWSWFHGFPSLIEAEQFVKWCDANGFDNRGVYLRDGIFSVRWR